MDMNATEVMEQGMRCLVDNIGIVEAERFIAVIMQEKFDYTKWQRDYFDKISSAELEAEVARFNETHPYRGNAKIIIG